MNIRQADTADFPAVRTLGLEFGQILSTCTSMDALDPTFTGKDYYTTFVSGKDAFCYVAKETEIVGFILFNVKQREAYWKVKKVGYIDLVVVSAKQREKGIGKKLVTAAMGYFKKKKLPYVELSVQTKNSLALQVWKKMGFEEYKVEMYKKV